MPTGLRWLMWYFWSERPYLNTITAHMYREIIAVVLRGGYGSNARSPHNAVVMVSLNGSVRPLACSDGVTRWRRLAVQGYMQGLYPSAKECFLSECAQPSHIPILAQFRSHHVTGL